ncbi:MAG: peptidoglycan-binding protein [Aristaeellaceae bacterium]
MSVILILALVCATPGLAALAEPVEQEAVEDDIYEGTDTSDYAELQRGDRDGDDSANIITLQNKLIELGYLRDTADGVFGANTESAVAAFQRSNGLTESGVADAATLRLLYSGQELVSASNSTDPESVIYRTQEKLSIWGFLAAEPDGVAGSQTNEAVAAFKEYLREYEKQYPTPSPEPTATPVPGSFGDEAIAVDTLIVKEDETKIDEHLLAYVDGEYEFQIYRQTVANGDKGDEVTRVQRRLYQLKYLPIVDGAFGPSTERSLLYFQRKNGLNQTAVADEATQRVLFSSDAIESEEFVCPYKLVVDVSDQRVYVYQWNGSSFGTCIKEMICSTGMKGASTETPLGTFQMDGPTGTGEWYWFSSYKCYAKWASRIVGGILFHSVIYSKGKVLNKTSVRKLGKRASHGCIRLTVEDAQWIYENCPSGTTVVIQD